MKHIQITVLAASLLLSAGAYADMVSDAHGNVGYDTAAECDAAVHNGSAKFYQSFTHKPALKRKGEKSVSQATIRDLGPEYQYGACDLGVGRKLGRDGVSQALQGKYIPFSPDMPVNVYADASGKPVRVTMQQCDNWFSGAAPRPVAAPPRREEPAPQPAPEPAPAPEPEKPRSSVRPYLFGTIGALQDGVRQNGVYTGHEIIDDRDTRVAGQIGAGVQFNNIVGVELFYQASGKHRYETKDYGWYDDEVAVRNNTYGARVTLGSDIGEKFRLFGKLGVAGVRHSDGDGYKKTHVRPTVGLGALFKINEHFGIRADYDHYFSKKSGQYGQTNLKWKGANYLGAGVQYTF